MNRSLRTVPVGSAYTLAPGIAPVLAFCLTLAALLWLLAPAARAELCPNEALRTGPSEHLPDCRAYEMVTPVEVNGGYLKAEEISPEGESMALDSIAGFAGATSDLSLSNGYEATRTPSGWTTAAEDMSEAQYIDHHELLGRDILAETFGNVETSLGGDGARVFVVRQDGEPQADLGLYLTRTDGTQTEIGPAVPPTASNLGAEHNEGNFIQVYGISADASHVIFKDPEPEGPNQWSFGAPGALLEYAGTGNREPMLVGVEDDGAFADGCPDQRLGGFAYGRGHGEPAAYDNAISSNGRTVFFTDECEGELFARIDNGLPGAHTVAISEPSPADCAECDTEAAVRAEAHYAGASEDGSRAFFVTAQPLLPGASGENMYEYDFDAPEGHRVVRVSDGPALAAGASSGYEGYLQVSQDGSHVYFVASSVLSEVANGDGQVAQAGANNLYVFEHDGEHPNGYVAFVTDFSSSGEDFFLWRPGQGDAHGFGSNVTPDGRFLVFAAHTRLTPDDTSTASQIFEYDAQTGSLVRVSVGNDGYNNDGNTVRTADEPLDYDFTDEVDTKLARASTQEYSYLPSQYDSDLSVSADGSYVFFTSADALTPQALDYYVTGESQELPLHPNFAKNVYEYHAGHVYLISDGQDVSSRLGGTNVELQTTTLSGRDVFFTSTDPLVPQDTGSGRVVYDARVDGGFPPPTEPPSCEGDACQGGLSGAPVLLSPGSEFQAGGNPPIESAPPVASSAPKAAKQGTKKAKRKKAKAKRTGSARRASRGSARRARARGKGGRSR